MTLIALLATVMLGGGTPDGGTTVKPMPAWKEHPVKWKMFDAGLPYQDSPVDW